jgi:hypothetical protein
MNIRATVTLPFCAKGKTYRLLIPLLLNGIPYPNFTAFATPQSGYGITGKVRKTNYLGSVVTSTWTPQTPHSAAIIELLIDATTTAALDVEQLVYELEFFSPTDVLGVMTGTIPVRQEVSY